jgi:tRNA A37 threonylcarbamoyladenosine biosynthesis protein TsaE
MAIGAGEYFKRSDTVTVIEWADKIKSILPEESIFAAISPQNYVSRIITINNFYE